MIDLSTVVDASASWNDWIVLSGGGPPFDPEREPWPSGKGADGPCEEIVMRWGLVIAFFARGIRVSILLNYFDFLLNLPIPSIFTFFLICNTTGYHKGSEFLECSRPPIKPSLLAPW